MTVLDPLLELRRGVGGVVGLVERAEHLVADAILHHALALLDDRGHEVEALHQEAAGDLVALLVVEAGAVHDVREQDGLRLRRPLVRRVLSRPRSSTSATGSSPPAEVPGIIRHLAREGTSASNASAPRAGRLAPRPDPPGRRARFRGPGLRPGRSAHRTPPHGLPASGPVRTAGLRAGDREDRGVRAPRVPARRMPG